VPAGDTDKRIKNEYAASLLTAIDLALAVRPDGRPQDIADFRALIDGRVGLEGGPSSPQTILPGADFARSGAGAVAVPSRRSKLPKPSKPSKPSKRSKAVAGGARTAPRWRPMAIAAAIVVVLMGGGAFGWMKYQEAEENRLAAAAAAAAEKTRLTVEKARAESARRRESARFARAAVEAEERAELAARRAAWIRRVRQQRRADEARRAQQQGQIKAGRSGEGGLIGGVKSFFERILPGAGAK